MPPPPVKRHHALWGVPVLLLINEWTLGWFLSETGTLHTANRLPVRMLCIGWVGFLILLACVPVLMRPAAWGVGVLRSLRAWLTAQRPWVALCTLFAPLVVVRFLHFQTVSSRSGSVESGIVALAWVRIHALDMALWLLLAYAIARLTRAWWLAPALITYLAFPLIDAILLHYGNILFEPSLLEKVAPFAIKGFLDKTLLYWTAATLLCFGWIALTADRCTTR